MGAAGMDDDDGSAGAAAAAALQVSAVPHPSDTVGGTQQAGCSPFSAKDLLARTMKGLQTHYTSAIWH